MVKKIIGYFLSIIGIIGLAITNIQKIKKAINLNFPIEEKGLMIFSAVLIIIGVILIATKKNKHSKIKEEDIPVRKNGKIIEYKRE